MKGQSKQRKKWGEKGGGERMDVLCLRLSSESIGKQQIIEKPSRNGKEQNL